MWHLQYIEDALHTYLTMKIDIRRPGAVSESEARELLAKQRHATLGTALRTAQKNEVLPATLLKRLAHLKEERDWLVHRSLVQNGASLYTDVGRNATFQRLDAFVEEAISIHRALMAEVTSFTESHGLSIANADALGRQKIARLKGDA